MGKHDRLRQAAPYLIGGAALGALLALPGALAYGFLHPPRRVHIRTPKTALGLDYERLRLRTGDGMALSAWFIPHPAPRGVAVLSHGYSNCRDAMLPYAALLHAEGFSVLLYDFRGHGWSERARITFGLKETSDLTAALDFAQARADGLPLVLVGESMGAAVSLLVAADDPRVAAVIADCPFARLDEPIHRRLVLLFGPTLGEVLSAPTRRVGERLLGVSPEAIAPEEAIVRIAPRPVLLIHGTDDQLIPVSHVHRLHDASEGHAEVWTVPGARHARSVYEAPDDYARHIHDFLERAIPSPS